MACRVLIVDDDELTLEILATILNLKDFEVRAVRTGAAALVAVEEQLPDVIVCDLMLPDIDGFEVTREIRSRPDATGIPIVLLTARTEDQARQEGLEAGATEYVTKPFSPLELIETVSRLRSRPDARAS